MPIKGRMKDHDGLAFYGKHLVWSTRGFGGWLPLWTRMIIARLYNRLACLFTGHDPVEEDGTYHCINCCWDTRIPQDRVAFALGIVFALLAILVWPLVGLFGAVAAGLIIASRVFK